MKNLLLRVCWLLAMLGPLTVWAGPPAGLPPPMAMPVKAAQAQTQAIQSTLEAVGDLLAGESVVLRPEISGRIAAIGFDEGQKVKAGEVLIGLNADEQRAALAQSQSTVQVEQQGFQRIREILGRNLVSQQQYDEALARLQNAQAVLERDRVRLSKTVLSAPFAGIVGLRQISIGDYVSPGQNLVNLESLDPIKLDFKLPEKYSGHIGKGLKLTVSVDAFPGRLFSGEIMAVDPRLESATRTLRVRARLPNADLALKPGMFARVKLDLGAARRGVFVPEQAVEAKGSSYSLFRIVDGKTVFTPVQLGERQPGVVEISSGVKAGDWVVVEGQLKLMDGMAVTILPQVAP